eukprot:349686-Chlamydomonas_euryale.AAC.5
MAVCGCVAACFACQRLTANTFNGRCGLAALKRWVLESPAAHNLKARGASIEEIWTCACPDLHHMVEKVQQLAPCCTAPHFPT